MSTGRRLAAALLIGLLSGFVVLLGAFPPERAPTLSTTPADAGPEAAVAAHAKDSSARRAARHAKVKAKRDHFLAPFRKHPARPKAMPPKRPAPEKTSVVAATPRDLSTTACYKDGELAWVTWQGEWRCELVCPGPPAQNEIVFAANAAVPDGGAFDAGFGPGGPGPCWVRGTYGYPGAGYHGAVSGDADYLLSSVFVDPVNGDDANDCTAPDVGRSCRTLEEFVRRIGPDQFAPWTTIQVVGSPPGIGFPDSHRVALTAMSNIVVLGLPSCSGAYHIAAFTPWDGESNTLGAMTVVADDGGAPLDFLAYNATTGHVLQVLDGGSEPGLILQIGPVASDAGSAYTPGGSPPLSGEPMEPVAGDPVTLCTLTPLATNPNANLFLSGAGSLLLAHFQVGSPVSGWNGNGQHTVQSTLAVETDACITAGWDNNGSDQWSNGSAHLFGWHVWRGTIYYAQAFLLQYAEARFYGAIDLAGPGIVGVVAYDGGTAIPPHYASTFSQTIEVGGADGDLGPGSLTIEGPVAAVSCFNAPCVYVRQHSDVRQIAPFWSVDVVTVGDYVPPVAQVENGSVWLVAPGVAPPAALGPQSALPWIVGGVGYDGGTFPVVSGLATIGLTE